MGNLHVLVVVVVTLCANRMYTMYMCIFKVGIIGIAEYQNHEMDIKNQITTDTTSTCTLPACSAGSPPL